MHVITAKTLDQGGKLTTGPAKPGSIGYTFYQILTHMIPINDPGPWQHFVKRQDNLGMPIEVVTRKYLSESFRFQDYMQALMAQVNNVANPSIGGASYTATTSALPSSCIEFVNNTTLGLNSALDFTTSGPVDYTLNWGDGTIDTGTADGVYNISHTYTDIDQSYTCRLCFEDITLVTELDFLGND